MASPTSSTTSLVEETASLLPKSNSNHPEPAKAGTAASKPGENTRSNTVDTRRPHLHCRPATQTTLQRIVGWEVKGREPYHDYIHGLVDAGWDNLKGLNDYMSEDWEDENLVISVLDITHRFKQKRYPDIRDVPALKKFLSEESHDGVKVRFYLVEQDGALASGVIEALGGLLGLDPRFFQWNLFGNKRILSPAERHRAPFTSIGFTVPKGSTVIKDEEEYFRVSIYIKSDETSSSWTGPSSISM
jgi:hypothetical protein